MEVTLQAQIVGLRTSVEASLTGARAGLAPPAPEARWAPGEQMTARVEASLPGGRFHVRVDNALLEMHLPDEFRPGDRLQLQFVSAQPRPTFVLQTEQDAAPRQDVQLSRASRAVSEILKLGGAELDAPATVKGTSPLLSAPGIDTSRLAQALSNAVSNSGLFYESHQSQWASGQRTTADLLNEPQGKLSALIRGDSASERILSSPADSRSGLDAAKLASVGTPALADNDNAVVPLPVHQDSITQVRTQLQALETQQFVWQGQLWPGQELEWTVQGPDDDGEKSNDDAQPWFTQLRLRLPRLGALTADIALIDGALRVHLAAENAGAQQQMSEGRAALADALSAAGMDLVSFKVASGGD
jgi:hypothetical protein